MSTERRKLVYVRGAMIGRCTDPANPSFANYGGRGISVCQRWLESVQAFIDDMGPRPPGGMLDRMDNDGNYTPENCRWASREQQNRNRRNCIRAPDGRTLKEYCRDNGLNYRAIVKRVTSRNWPVDRAVSTPIAPVMNFGPNQRKKTA